VATQEGIIDIQQKICGCFEEKLSSEEIKNVMLLHTDDERRNA
jgi:hypothetical protein